MLKHKCAGQSIAEYAVVIGLVIAAVVAMQIYVKRGLQAKIHDASLVEVESDSAGINYGVNDNQDHGFDPSSQAMDAVVSTRNVTQTVEVSEGGGVKKSSDEYSSRSGGNQQVLDVSEAGD